MIWCAKLEFCTLEISVVSIFFKPIDCKEWQKKFSDLYAFYVNVPYFTVSLVHQNSPLRQTKSLK